MNEELENDVIQEDIPEIQPIKDDLLDLEETSKATQKELEKLNEYFQGKEEQEKIEREKEEQILLENEKLEELQAKELNELTELEKQELDELNQAELERFDELKEILSVDDEAYKDEILSYLSSLSETNIEIIELETQNINNNIEIYSSFLVLFGLALGIVLSIFFFRGLYE